LATQNINGPATIFKLRTTTTHCLAIMAAPEHVRATYNDIHDLIKASSEKIAEFKPNMIIAIGT
jgi:hypothetical protein